MSEITARDVLRIVLGSGQPHLVLCVNPASTAKHIERAAQRMRVAARELITQTDKDAVLVIINEAEEKLLSGKTQERA